MTQPPSPGEATYLHFYKTKGWHFTFMAANRISVTFNLASEILRYSYVYKDH